jgi:hypothetical protein
MWFDRAQDGRGASPVVRMAHGPVPAALVRQPSAGMAGAVRPSHVVHIGYPSAPATSAELTAKAALVPVREASCDAEGAIRNRVATPKPKGSASETIRPIRNLNVIGSRRSRRRSERSDSRGAL